MSSGELWSPEAPRTPAASFSRLLRSQPRKPGIGNDFRGIQRRDLVGRRGSEFRGIGQDEAIRARFARKEKIPGFGHRVYRTEDPRATHLRQVSQELGKRAGNTAWFDMSQRIEALVKAEKKLNPNVDFYSASTYYTLGIPIDLYTPIFAVSRMSGWTAHVLEQYANNRLIRPRADYIGPEYPQRFVPLDQR